MKNSNLPFFLLFFMLPHLASSPSSGCVVYSSCGNQRVEGGELRNFLFSNKRANISGNLSAQYVCIFLYSEY